MSQPSTEMSDNCDDNFSTIFECTVCLEKFTDIVTFFKHKSEHGDAHCGPRCINIRNPPSPATVEPSSPNQELSHNSFKCVFCELILYSDKEFDEHVDTHNKDNSLNISVCDEPIVSDLDVPSSPGATIATLPIELDFPSSPGATIATLPGEPDFTSSPGATNATLPSILCSGASSAVDSVVFTIAQPILDYTLTTIPSTTVSSTVSISCEYITTNSSLVPSVQVSTGDTAPSGVPPCEGDPTCSYCEKKFQTSFELNLHLTTHRLDSLNGADCQLEAQVPTHTETCVICNDIFTSRLSLLEHFKTHISHAKSSPKHRRCKSLDTNVLDEFIPIKVNKDSLTCPICSVSIEHDQSLEAHLKLHVNGELITPSPPDVPRSTPSPPVVIQQSDSTPKCHLCGWTCKSKKGLNYHLRFQHKVANSEKLQYTKRDNPIQSPASQTSSLDSQSGYLPLNRNLPGESSGGGNLSNERIEQTNPAPANRKDGISYKSSSTGDGYQPFNFRRGPFLSLTFPCRDDITCTEDGCPQRFHSDSDWCTLKGNLIRHLRVIHGEYISSYKLWCKLCKNETGPRPTKHSCFTTRPLMTKTTVWPFKCTICDFSCSNNAGLLNHVKKHKTMNRLRMTPEVKHTPARDLIKGIKRNHVKPANKDDGANRARYGVHSPVQPPQDAQPDSVPQSTVHSNANDRVSIPKSTNGASTLATNVDATADSCITGPSCNAKPPINKSSVNNSNVNKSNVNKSNVNIIKLSAKEHPKTSKDPSNCNVPVKPKQRDALKLNDDGWARSVKIDEEDSNAVLTVTKRMTSRIPRIGNINSHSMPVIDLPEPSPSAVIDNNDDWNRQTNFDEDEGNLVMNIIGDSEPDQLNKDDSPPREVPPTPEVDVFEEEEHPLAAFKDALANIDLQNPDCWTQFCKIVKDITDEASSIVKLPPPRSPPTSVPDDSNKLSSPLNDQGPPAPKKKFDLNDATLIQKAYRRNKRRVMRDLTGNSGGFCEIDKEVIEEHFKNIFKPKIHDPSLYDLSVMAPASINLAPFSKEEVRKRLMRFSNTAPGPDRLTFSHWKSVDPDCSILTSIFNYCITFQQIPDVWKLSRVILIPKCDTPECVSDFRPISLSSTIYKIYTGVLCNRMMDWMMTHNVLSCCQKGFMPFDGVLENNFVLNTRVRIAREQKEDICLASLDLTNAFGAIPHSAIFNALDKYGAGEEFINIIKDIYLNSKVNITTKDGETNIINVEAGVKQGDPISGPLFNIGIDPIIRAIQGDFQNPYIAKFDHQFQTANFNDDDLDDFITNAAYGKPEMQDTPPPIMFHKVLAYADDLNIIASNPDDLNRSLLIAAEHIRKIGIDVNVKKCFSLHLSGKRPVGVRDTSFSFNGIPITTLKEEEKQKFLGVPVGFRLAPDNCKINQYINLGETILNSKLAPWQRLDAIKTFLYPAMAFDMRNGIHQKTVWKKVDDALRPLIKKTLGLPIEAANEYLYGDTQAGLLGIPNAADDSDIALIDTAFKLLSSKDPFTSQLAWEDLTCAVFNRLNRAVEDIDFANFLSQANTEEERARSNKGSSIWTRARQASGRLGVTWKVEGEDFSLSHKGTTIYKSQRTKVFRLMRANIRYLLARQLIETKPSQGKALESVGLDRASSHFLQDGSFTRFCDWRFVHKARLNLQPLNGSTHVNFAAQRRPGFSTKCRRCFAVDEHLPHVLHHCMRYSRLYVNRHNSIIERIKKAASNRFNIIGEDCQIEGVRGLRPDLVIARGNKAYIIDATCIADSRIPAFRAARKEKMEKYLPVLQALKTKYNTVEIHAIIVGSLGAWDNLNNPFLAKICSRSYGRLMKKLIVSDVIRASRNIYVEHITGHVQQD